MPLKQLSAALEARGAALSRCFPASGSLPSLTVGAANLFGELFCQSTGHEISFHVEGHYGLSGSTLVPEGFAAPPESDPDTTYVVNGEGTTGKITPQLNPNAIGLQVVFGSGNGLNYSCTSELHMMIAE